MNGYLWSKDRIITATGLCTARDTLCAPQPSALRKWSVVALEEALAAQPHPNGATVYRGKQMRATSQAEALAYYQVNGLVWSPGFESSSLDQEVALGYTELAQPVNVLYVMTLGAATTAAELQTQAQEVLLPPGLVFKITAVTVHNNYAAQYKGTAFVLSNGCGTGVQCNGVWPTLIEVALTESVIATTNLVTEQQAVENLCAPEQFVRQCNDHTFIQRKRKTQPLDRLYREIVGTTSSNCTHNNVAYKCETKSVRGGCYACVLCEDVAQGTIEAKGSRIGLPTDVCKKGFHKEGLWFIDPTA